VRRLGANGIHRFFAEESRFTSPWGFLLLVLALLTGWAQAAEVIPSKPTRYFNDYAGVITPSVANDLDRKLENFERTDSSQILVAIYPKMQSESSVADYSVRVAQAWGVGQKGKNNGAVLFIFVQEHQIFLQVGYGLEGAIPDAIAKSIIERKIKPRFKAGDFNGGLVAGVDAILAAARGEYKGTGRTVNDQRHRGSGGIPFLLLFIVLIVLFAAARRSQGTVYRRSGRSQWTGWPGGWGGGGWGGGWGGGGGGGGGGWSGGSSGGFSSGGGSFGGGGAGGQW
jgi:uncharacterized protein